MPVKVAITGHFRVGKDTFADMLAKALPSSTTRLRFADALKLEVATMTFNFVQPDGEIVAEPDDNGYSRIYAKRGAYVRWEQKMVADRHLNGLAWQWWGEWRRQKTDLDYWIRHPLLQAQYREALDANSNVVVADMRHVNEAEWCRSQGFHLVRIVGPCRSEGERRDPNHASESSVDSLPVDSVLPNTGGLNELRDAARAFAAFLVG